MKQDKEPTQIKFKANGRTYTGYIIAEYKSGRLQVSENKTSKDMGFCQNWIISKEDIISSS